MDYDETGTQGHPEPDFKSDGFHSFDKDGWISVKKALPEMDMLVWLWTAAEEYMFIGLRMDKEGGWLWADCKKNEYYWNEDRWQAYGAHIDADYKPTHWKRLPMPPEVKNAPK